MTIGGVVAFDEIEKVFKLKRGGLEGVVYVGALVVTPHFFGCITFTGGAVVEEEDVGLQALRAKDAAREAENGMRISRF